MNKSEVAQLCPTLCNPMDSSMPGPSVKLLTLCPGPFLSKFVEIAHNDYTFKKIKPVTALHVAKFGYKKSLKGKSLAIVGFKNRLTIFITRFFPRKIVTAVSAKNMKKGA